MNYFELDILHYELYFLYYSDLLNKIIKKNKLTTGYYFAFESPFIF